MSPSTISPYVLLLTAWSQREKRILSCKTSNWFKLCAIFTFLYCVTSLSSFFSLFIKRSFNIFHSIFGFLINSPLVNSSVPLLDVHFQCSHRLRKWCMDWRSQDLQQHPHLYLHVSHERSLMDLWPPLRFLPSFCSHESHSIIFGFCVWKNKFSKRTQEVFLLLNRAGGSTERRKGEPGLGERPENPKGEKRWKAHSPVSLKAWSLGEQDWKGAGAEENWWCPVGSVRDGRGKQQKCWSQWNEMQKRRREMETGGWSGDLEECLNHPSPVHMKTENQIRKQQTHNLSFRGERSVDHHRHQSLQSIRSIGWEYIMESCINMISTMMTRRVSNGTLA